MQEYLNKFAEMAIAYAPKIVLALVALIVGMWIINNIVKFIGKAMDKSSMDKDLKPFLLSIASVLMKIMLLLSVAGIVGIETTSFIAVLGAATFAIGMALQGSLGNFASGVMILLFKPYRVGDLINAQGQVGTVDEIQIFNTILTSLDNKKVIIPNAIATSGIITNLSTLNLLRVDLNVTMPYEEDFTKVQGIILEALRNTPGVKTDPAPVVEIESFGENGAVLCVRPYATTADYWDVYFNSYKNIKAALGKHGIDVPYPKRLMKNL